MPLRRRHARVIHLSEISGPMLCFLLIIENEKERQILSVAFEQMKIKVITSTPTYSNYVKATQYNPDLILMEIPRINTDQVHFVNLVRKNYKTKKIPVFAYGAKIEEGIKRHLMQNGISVYIEKPLKFSNLMQTIKKYLQMSKKSLADVEVKNKSEKEGDIEQIIDMRTIASRKIDLIIKHISKCMAFPFTVARVLQLSEDSKSGAVDLAKTIEADPVIAALLLKISNSVFFASLNTRISSIKDAIVRIGFKETKRIVTTMSVMNTFVGTTQKSAGFSALDFWYHSLTTALVAEQLARNLTEVKRDEVFLSGLLHDFCIIILNEFYPALFEKSWKKRSIPDAGSTMRLKRC